MLSPYVSSNAPITTTIAREKTESEINKAKIRHALENDAGLPTVIAKIIQAYTETDYSALATIGTMHGGGLQIPDGLKELIKELFMSADASPKSKEQLLNLTKSRPDFGQVLKELFDEIAMAGGRVTLDGVYLENIRFDHWNLSGMSADNATFKKVDFGAANLAGAFLLNVTFENTTFAQAKLSGATWQKVTCSGVEINQMIVNRMKTDDNGLLLWLTESYNLNYRNLRKKCLVDVVLWCNKRYSTDSSTQRDVLYTFMDRFEAESPFQLAEPKKQVKPEKQAKPKGSCIVM